MKVFLKFRTFWGVLRNLEEIFSFWGILRSFEEAWQPCLLSEIFPKVFKTIIGEYFWTSAFTAKSSNIIYKIKRIPRMISLLLKSIFQFNNQILLERNFQRGFPCRSSYLELFSNILEKSSWMVSLNSDVRLIKEHQSHVILLSQLN